MTIDWGPYQKLANPPPKLPMRRETPLEYNFRQLVYHYQPDKIEMIFDHMTSHRWIKVNGKVAGKIDEETWVGINALDEQICRTYFTEIMKMIDEALRPRLPRLDD